MVGAAFLHFALVELKPLIAVGVTTLSIYAAMMQMTYNSEVPCTCMPGCTQQDTFDQNNALLQSAITSLTATFNATSACMSLQVVTGVHYGSWFYVFLLTAFLIVYSACLVMFIVEACKYKFSSIQSGAYLVFTLELEKRCLYRVVIRTYLFSLFIVFILGTILILVQSNMNFQLIWAIIQKEILPLLVLLMMSKQLLSPANLTEFSSWDLTRLRQVRFRRTCCSVLFDPNDALYQRIGRILEQCACDWEF